MRYFGWIKWYDGINKIGRMVINQGKKEMQFYNDRNLNPHYFSEDDYVTFELNEQKTKAIHVKPFSKEDDIESVVRIIQANSNRIDIWSDSRNDIVLNKYFNNADVYWIKNIIERIRLPQITIERAEQLISLIPGKVIFNDDIWNILTIREQEIAFISISGKIADIHKSLGIMEKLKQLILKKTDSERITFISKLPDQIQYHNYIYEYISPSEKVKLLNRLYSSKLIEIEEYKSQLFQQTNKSVEAFNKPLEEVPEELHSDIELFPMLNYRHQVNVLWKSIEHADKYWVMMGNAGKVAAIFRCVKEGKDLSWLTSLCQDEWIGKLIQLANKDISQQEKKVLFSTWHEEFQEFIINQAWDLDSHINIKPLLPVCSKRIVEFCEGKCWNSVDDGAFCPRENNKCNFVDGARIYANIALPWEKWSLLEYIEANNIPIEIKDIKDCREYVPRMAGWVNRLIEIRKRLRCSVCGRPLQSNKKYSKNLARYNATIFYCDQGEGHDNNVYISHCWSCRKLIDSRHDWISFQGYYICKQCGSGPQNSMTFTQGDICPNCGAKKMQPLGNFESDRICMECKHIIKMPPTWKVTGVDWNS